MVKREKYRMEKDALGLVPVPEDAYYGAETERAVKLYNVSGLKVQGAFISTYVRLKKCAALANMKAGKLDARKAKAIVRACSDVLEMNLLKEPGLDIFQAGAGTNINMYVNEVIANRAIEILGGRKGEYKIIHPNDDVNLSQSTNDTMPSAIRISSYASAVELSVALEILRKRLSAKAGEFSSIVKVGRTHLQDAVPIRLGSEFSGYAGQVQHAISFMEIVMKGLLRIPIGGTAVGTGINAGSKYRKYMISELRNEFRIKLVYSENFFADMQARLAELDLSNAVSETAVAVGTIANDIRLMASGPDAGIGEISLPAVHPGSSIMPGKVNPSVAEMMNMVCFQVLGSGTTIREACASGQLELNVFTPVIAYNLLFSMGILSRGAEIFAERCIRGIRAERRHISDSLGKDSAIATALAPYIGYAKAAEVVAKARRDGKGIMETCLRMKVLDRKKLERILDASKMA